jgi:hypothetical protein
MRDQKSFTTWKHLQHMLCMKLLSQKARIIFEQYLIFGDCCLFCIVLLYCLLNFDPIWKLKTTTQLHCWSCLKIHSSPINLGNFSPSPTLLIFDIRKSRNPNIVDTF